LEGQALFLIRVVEAAVPFVRMLAMSRLLPLRELGFASALTATYATFEAVTDFAIYRFVFSTPRKDFDHALASAHGLSFLRGLAAGLLAVAASPLIAEAFSLRAEWGSFAAIGGIIVIRSLEHLAERDYRRPVQGEPDRQWARAGRAGGGFDGRAELLRGHRVAVWPDGRSGRGEPRIGGDALPDEVPHAAFHAGRFGYPLMFNGMGLAASSQGDRFVVGAMLGLPTLGVYAVATLVAAVPLSMIGRVTATVVLAALYNASRATDNSYLARVRLTARVIPLVGASFALAVLTLMNIIVPIVFGRQFLLSRAAVALLALATFVKLARGDPMTSMLLHEGRTRRLAIANLTSASAVPLQIVLIFLFGSLEAALLGRLLGEIVAMTVVLHLARKQLREAWRDQAVAMGVGLAALAGAILVGLAAPVGVRAAPSLALLFACLAAFGVWAARFAPPLLRAAFPGQNPFAGLT